MCGIAGCVVAHGGRPDEAALARMASALGHRGPDDSGVEVAGSVGFAHTRLAIVDPSPAGRQPMRGAGGWWLTYNGEVFNHASLRPELGGDWRGGSDTETVLRALARWGPDAALPRFNGLFALAALNASGDRVVLARDRFGVKPLYMAEHGGALWFASEIGALLAAGVPREPARDVIAFAVARGWANGPWAPIAGIRRLMPGTLAEVDVRTLAVDERRWYDPLDVVDPDAPPAGIDELEEALRTAVRRRLMADVPVGTMCSGGIDSSLITAYAHDAENAPVHAFNASVTDQPDYDEGEWARRVADHLGIELHTVEMTAESWRADLVGVVSHVEYPLTHESSVPMMQIAALARSLGVKVLLSGEGADELFGGYSWLHHEDVADFSARNRGVESIARATYRRLQRRGIGRQSLREPIPGPSERVNEWERRELERAIAAYGHHRGARRRVEGGLAWDIATYLPHLLNRQDKTTMQASIETRVPFLDPDVVALALNMPLELRIEPERKGLLRELARRRLPAGVADRPKIGFGFDVGAYIGSAARPEFLTEGRLREVLEVDRATWSEAVADQQSLLVWTGEIWCRLFLDGETVDAVEDALWARGPMPAAAL
jgi:asparagine synthase (glutamine-hydrolysing)